MTEQKSGCGAILASINKRRIEWRNAQRIANNERHQKHLEIRPVQEGSLSAAEKTILIAALSEASHITSPLAQGIYTTATEKEINQLLKRLGLKEKAKPVSVSKRSRT